jgi:hypothetical protein
MLSGTLLKPRTAPRGEFAIHQKRTKLFLASASQRMSGSFSAYTMPGGSAGCHHL